MKSVTLLRHAKSSWDDSVPRDLDRPLNDKGHRAAETMGRHVASLGLTWDCAVASPAVRVVETLESFEQGLGQTIEVATDRRIYMAHVDTLVELVHEQDSARRSLLLVGHNPGLEDLALLLSEKYAAPERAAIETKYPTATLCQMEFDVDDWAEIAPGTGRIRLLVRPRDVDPTLGPDF